MSKITWKPGTMVYPVPAAMVSCGTMENANIITIAWTGTINSTPAMAYISVRKERYSYDIIKSTGEFVINVTTKDLVRATDYCGVKSGRDVDKFKEMKLTKQASQTLSVPLISESPVNIECKVKEIIELGSHDMFLAEVTAVNVDDRFLEGSGRFRLDKANPIAYSHGGYYELGNLLGTFGYSIQKKKTKTKKSNGPKSNINKEKIKNTHRKKQSDFKSKR